MAIIKHAEKSISILGSTGSIGQNTVDVISNSKEHYEVIALTANSNVELLAKQAKSLNAKVAVIGDKTKYKDLKKALSGTKIEIIAGSDAIIDAAARGSNIVMSAIVGSAGLLPTMEAIKRGASVALANKECLVCAGDIMMDEVKRSDATLIPVDSEHSAIFQIFDFNNPKSVSKIILTASGGPFRTFTKEQMAKATPKQAVNHPNWSMGDKISIDSATMMNKGLEIIEAYYLFPIDKEQIDVVVHPESIIHSMVEYTDGSVLAQLGTPDMRTPISVALCWPNRMELQTEKLGFLKTGSLNFKEVDHTRFPSINLAKQALESGGAAPIIFNTANEIAVDKFLNGQISFMQIFESVENALQRISLSPPKNLNDVLNCIEQTTQKLR